MNEQRAFAPALVMGGLMWTAAAAVGAHAHGLRFNLAETLWITSDVAILWGFSRLPSRRFGALARNGLALALLARTVFIAAEVVSLVQQRDSNALLPIAAAATALGMTTYGVAVARRTDHRFSRFSPLAVGLYPFAFMFPFVAITGEPNLVAIAGWGIVIAALGTTFPKPGLVRPAGRQAPAAI